MRLFISHAGEDKADVARPLAEELTARGFDVWYDEFVLSLGDSLAQEIDRGLATCEFGIVILSHRFFDKPWPRKELDGLVARETGEGAKRILPVWHNITHREVAEVSPILADRVAISTEQGIETVADAVQKAVSRAKQGSASKSSPPRTGQSANVPEGYQRRINKLRFEVARRSKAQQQDGSYSFPVVVRGRTEDLRRFLQTVNTRYGVQEVVTEIWEEGGEARFQFRGAASPDSLERVAHGHGLTVIQCWPLVKDNEL